MSEEQIHFFKGDKKGFHIAYAMPELPCFLHAPVHLYTCTFVYIGKEETWTHYHHVTVVLRAISGHDALKLLLPLNFNYSKKNY